MNTQIQRRNRKSFSALMVILLGLSIITSACAGTATPNPTAAPAATAASTNPTAPAAAPTKAPATAAPITLKMTAWDVAKTPYWQTVVSAYQAKNPNVKIELIDIPSAEYQDKVNVMLSGGDQTDIITVKDIPGYSAMLTRNQIIPINDYVTKDKLDLGVYSGAADELTFNSKIYALPFRSDVWILYYNKDLFDKAGVPYPSNDMTWSQFDATARKLTKGSGADKVYGAHFHVWRSTVELPTVQDGKNTVIASDYAFMKPMYDMVIAMQKDGIIMDYGALKAGSLHYSGVFQNQQTAMLPMGSWFIGTMIAAQNKGDVKFKWGVAKYPHPEGVAAGTTASTLTSLAINTNSKNKDAAWDFIKFYSGVEGAKVLAGTGNLPAILNAETLKTFAGVAGVPAEAAQALQTVKVRLELPMHTKVSAVEKILNEQHDLIMTKSVTVDKGIADMTSRVKAELAK
jgi:multiple sugar transport system substrate-binding protein